MIGWSMSISRAADGDDRAMIAIPPRIAGLGGVRAGTNGCGARSGGLRDYLGRAGSVERRVGWTAASQAASSSGVRGARHGLVFLC